MGQIFFLQIFIAIHNEVAKPTHSSIGEMIHIFSYFIESIKWRPTWKYVSLWCVSQGKRFKKYKSFIIQSCLYSPRVFEKIPIIFSSTNNGAQHETLWLYEIFVTILCSLSCDIRKRLWKICETKCKHCSGKYSHISKIYSFRKE